MKIKGRITANQAADIAIITLVVAAIAFIFYLVKHS